MSRVPPGQRLAEPIDLLVSDPDGPRARVDYPPFASSAPLVSHRVISLTATSSAARLELDLSEHPSAVRFIEAVDGQDASYKVSVVMQAHGSGNGYLMVRVADRSAEPGPNPTVDAEFDGIETALDPVLHHAAIESMVECDHILLVPTAEPGRAAIGMLVSVDPERVRQVQADALRHPRRVRFG
jgi:hypothetical protein